MFYISNSINYIIHTFYLFTNKFAQLNSFTYICNHTVADNMNNMRRDVFQAIADPTRRAILTLLAIQAMTPNALAEHFDCTRQAVSKHLKILTECELVNQQQTGREIHYQIHLDKMKEIDQWLSQFRLIWKKRFNELDNILLNLKRKKK